MSEIEAYLAAHETEAIEAIKSFCRIPSVSTDPAFGHGIEDAARFVSARLKRAGFPLVEQIDTGGHPMVFAQWCDSPSAPTILVYGHYDVQPPDPLDKWHSPPFDPTIRNGRLYARGVSDDKAPLMIPILVAEAFRAVDGKLPLNVKMLIEGEEESGSPHFESTVKRLQDRLACDLVVSADGAMWRADLCSMMVAGRGLVALDVTVEGAAKDLHSGRHGGSAPNPILALVGMLATLHDKDGNVTVDGFETSVVSPDPSILDAVRTVAFDAGSYFDDIGADRPVPLPDGEALLTRQWLRPTLEFNGISGGYDGPGTKTVIPSTASAKITCRLVAGQDPVEVVAAITRQLQKTLPSGLKLKTKQHGPGTAAFALDPNLTALDVAGQILAELLGAPPLRVAMGATIPIPGVFEAHLGVGTIFYSFSTSDEDYHAPNEHFRLSSLHTGLIAWARLYERLARPAGSSGQKA